MVTQEQRETLVRLFSKEEVKVTIKGLNDEGSPGPDSISVFFYWDCWDLVRPDVMATLEKLRQENWRIEKINKLHLFLLPKRQ